MLPQARATGASQQLDGLAFLSCLVALVLVTPYAVFSYFDELKFSPEIAVSTAILLYCAVRLSWLAAQGRARLLTITFFLFIYVWIGLAATAQLIGEQFPWNPLVHGEEDVLAGLLEVALAMAAFEAGHLWFRLRPPSPTAGAAFKGLNLVMSDRAVVWLSVIAVGLTLIGMAKFGFGNLLVTRSAVDAFWQKTGSKAEGLVTVTLLRTPSLVAFNVLAYNALRQWRTLTLKRKRFYFFMGLFMLGVYFVANYPPAQTRFWLGAVVLTPAFALPRWRRWFAPMWILAFAVALTVLFPYLDMFRYSATIEAGIDQLNTSETVTKKMLQKADYDVFQLTLEGHAYGEKQGVAWGRNLVGAALFWFPRSTWRDKPLGTGQTVAISYGRSVTNLSAPLWMEFYYAFGWLGVGCLMLLYARACAWGEALYEQSLAPGAPDSLSRLMVPYWAAFHMFILRGDLMNATAYSAFGYLMLLATAYGPRFLRPRPRPLVTFRNVRPRPIGTRPRLRP